MARIVAVLVTTFLWIVTTSDAGVGVHQATENEGSETRIEKHSMKAVKGPCETATYNTVRLYNYVYRHGCFPQEWEDFFLLQEVRTEIEKISDGIELAQGYPIQPPMIDIFKAFKVPLSKVKVVILGQDPTPQPNKATGMAFSLKSSEAPINVPSVLNMLVELKLEGMDVDLSNGDLTPWLEQGVLLLNSALTIPLVTVKVKKGMKNTENPNHLELWKSFTEKLVKYISDNGSSAAWILWGQKAKGFAKFIETPKHYMKAGAHPRVTTGFFGNNYFYCANEFLKNKKVNRGAVKWKLRPRGGIASFMADCGNDGL